MESRLIPLLLVATIIISALYLVFSKMPGWNDQETPEKQVMFGKN
jgi:hypothetical protein